MIKKVTILLSAVLFIVLALLPTSTFAVTIKVASGSGTDWNTASTWNPAQVPTSSDDVILDNTNRSGSYTITCATTGSACKTLTVGYSGNTNAIQLTLTGGGASTHCLSISDGTGFDLTIADGGIIQNNAACSSTGKGIAFTASTCTWTMTGTGKYVHNQAAGSYPDATSGNIAAPTFATTSTVEVQNATNWASNTGGCKPTYLSYPNLTINWGATQSIGGSSILNGNTLTVNGNLSLIGTSTGLRLNTTGTLYSFVHVIGNTTVANTCSLYVSTTGAPGGSITLDGDVTTSGASGMVAVNTSSTGTGSLKIGGNFNGLVVNSTGATTDSLMFIGGSGTTATFTSGSTFGGVRINKNITFNSAISTSSGSAFTVASACTLTVSAAITKNASTAFVINGALKMTTGGSITNVVTYGAGGTLIENLGTIAGGSYSIGASNKEWPTTSGPTNVVIGDGSSTAFVSISDNRTVPGTFTITPTCSCSVSSTNTLQVGGVITNNAGGSASGGFTLNGALQLNSGSSYAGNIPNYNSSSTLCYNQGTTYTVNSSSVEWPLSTTAIKSLKIGDGVTTTTVTIAANRIAGGPNSAATKVTVSSGSTFTINATDTLTLGNTASSYTDTVLISGTMNVNGVVILGGNSTPVTLVNSGTLNVGSAGALQFNLNAALTGTAPVYTSGATITYGSGGSYTAGTEWSTGGSKNVTVQNNTTVTTGAVTVGGTTTVATGSKLITTGTFTNSGTANINGSFQLNAGGWATGNNFVYGAAGTLIFNNTGSSYGAGNDAYWPATNGPVNVTVLPGGLTMNTSRSVSGIFQTSDGVSNAGNLTINGTAQLNTGGHFNSAPVYGSSATLIYNTGGTFDRDQEWNSTSPANITLQNNTTLNYPHGSSAAHSISGNLTINSGSALYMDYGSPSLNNPFTVGGNVTLVGALSLGDAVNGDLIVGGNWVNNGGTLTTNTRQIEFNGASKSIGGTSSTTFDYLKINNSAGISLAKNITVNATLTMAAGLLTTSSNTLTLGSSGSISGEATGQYVIGTVQTTRSVSGASPVSLGLGVSINPNGIDLGATTFVKRISGSTGAITIGPNTGINRKWTITPTTQPTGSVDVTLNWVSDDDNGKSLSTLHVWRSEDNGSSWSDFAGPIDCSGHSAAFSTSSFSDFTMSDGTAPLPVELTTLTSTANGRNVTLNWKTATEVNSSKFIIERSQNTAWSKVGEVAANGNSNSPKTYVFVDKNLNSGKYTYRLKMIDNDGTYEYSKIATSAEVATPDAFSVSQNYPNPFNPSTTINFDLPADGMVKLELFAITGSKVVTLINSVYRAGYNSIQLNMNSYNLSSGTYIYKLSSVEAGSGRENTQARKLIFIK